jgi:L-ascorbate metabolism protein UlaG (beta-lactamase superfamily)
VRIRWYGQSAFLLSGGHTVFIDPFGDMSAAAARGIEFNYPAVAGVSADLLLVTHEHGDHNEVGVIGGDPVTIRSTAGRFESPVGEVVAIASEHDDVAGTARGPNTIFRFELDGVRVCHLGDFGQRALRPEQRDAIGEVDVLFIPVGGGPTIGGEGAADVVRAIAPRVVVPMHYRTPAVNFLEPPDEFVAALGTHVMKTSSDAEIDGLEGVALLAAPVG